MTLMNLNYFMLFACCIPVRGASRSIICDLQRGTYKLIPNGLYEILTVYRNKSIREIKAVCGSEYDDIIDEYFRFLEENEFGLWFDQLDEGFIDIDLRWSRPEMITNAILDFNEYTLYDTQSVFSQLDDLGCKAVQMRFFSDHSIRGIKDILDCTKSGKLRGIELIIKSNHEIASIENLKSLALLFPRIKYILVHSADEENEVFVDATQVSIVYTRQVVNSAMHCGQISPYYFVSNIETFTEGQQFNSCLNRKISVDVEGNIKNCPSMEHDYGNVSQTALAAALMQKNFKKYWNINKDQIKVCKDCEFRYICTDCRAFIQNENDLYSKPSKCLYDPYAATWRNQEEVNVENTVVMAK